VATATVPTTLPLAALWQPATLQQQPQHLLIAPLLATAKPLPRPVLQGLTVCPVTAAQPTLVALAQPQQLPSSSVAATAADGSTWSAERIVANLMAAANQRTGGGGGKTVNIAESHQPQCFMVQL
jgi:hypothetical protein